jgi:hypothetical protein
MTNFNFFKFEAPREDGAFNSQKNLVRKGLIHQQRRKRFIDVVDKK